MKYNPLAIMHKEILTDFEKEWFLTLSKNYPLQTFLKDNRNFEEAAVDFVYTSAKIEGNTYDRLDTDSLIRGGRTAGGKQYSDALMILNLKNAFDMVIKCDMSVQIDKDYTCNLHAVLMDNLLLKEEQGLVRKTAVSISATEYEPLESFVKLSEEFKTIFEESKKYANVFERAIYLHCNLAYLQYFKDGNKRTARLIKTATLVQGGVLPLFFNEKLIDKYRRAIVNYYETGGYKQYIDFFKENYAMSIEKLLGKTPVLLEDFGQVDRQKTKLKP